MKQKTKADVQHTRFIGEFPFACLQAADDCFPDTVELTAFYPFIPLNDKDSSIPGAFFDIALHITTNQTVTYTINLSLTNPMQDHKRNHRYDKNDKIQLIKLFSLSHDFSAPDFGDLSIATDTEDVSYQEYCTSAAGSIIWRFFGRTSPKRPNLRIVLTTRPRQKGNGGDVYSLAAHFALKPGEKKSIRFVIAWS